MINFINPQELYQPTPGAPEPEKVKSLFNGISKSYDRFNRFASLGLDRGWRKNLVSSLLKEDLEGSVILDIGTGTGDLLFDVERGLHQEKVYGLDSGPGFRRDKLMCRNDGQERREKNCSLVGIDFSSQMLNVAYEKWKKKGGLITLMQADVSDLPVMANSVDYVVSAFVMRNIKKVLNRSLLEIRRVLKVRGKISVLEMYVPQNFVLKTLHRIYLDKILPLWGRQICGASWSGNYLPKTILEFGSPDQFSKKLESAGFRDINYRILLGGVAILHTARKP